jgi:rSAM/selenodomain-associated transferase 2/rSAM/selenodomain-associated transferase 1
MRTIPSEESTDQIIVFGRYPVPGQVKTRMIPALGPAGAAELHRRLSEQILVTSFDYGRRVGAKIQFCYDGGDSQRIKRWLPLPGLTHSPQSSGDLGRRMAAAFEAAFQEGCERAILIGTDMPDLSEAHLMAAFTALASHDVVLGPSSDGGYWLVGMKRDHDIFSAIPWGGDLVLEETLKKVRRLGLRHARLKVLRDLDTPEDLRRQYSENRWPKPYLSVVVPTLDEADHLEATLAPLMRPDVEVLVADGGSRDATREVATSMGAEIIATSQGRAVQQNMAARCSRGAVLLFLHADTLLPPDYMDHIFETLMDPHVVLGAFRFATDHNGLGMGLITWATRLRSTKFQLPYGDQGLFMRPETFNQLGGFPEVPIAEDLLLVRQARLLGRIIIAPAAAVTSGRRWSRYGAVWTTLVNYLIAGGCLAGVPPKYMAFLYGRRRRPRKVGGMGKKGS